LGEGVVEIRGCFKRYKVRTTEYAVKKRSMTLSYTIYLEEYKIGE